MDQRQRNEQEIAKMKYYFGNATGCLVWLDDAFEEGNWTEILAAIKEINKFFNMDEYSVPTLSVDAFIKSDGNIFEKKFNNEEAIAWITKILTVEKAPWFQRVWTLQEGVIPDNLFICTPERFMTSAATFFQSVEICEQVAKLCLDLGAMAGVAINHELQKSEIYKMLKLRQLYRRGEISFWHVAQAVRSRTCKLEQDRIFGVCGLVHGTIPIINYSHSIEELFRDLYKACVDDGDFSACLFLGGSSLVPDMNISMGFISPGDPKHPATHQLILTGNGLRLEGVGIDRVEGAHSIVCFPRSGPLYEWSRNFPSFLDMTNIGHIALAKAWNLPPEPVKFGDGQLIAGAWAALGSFSGLAGEEGVDTMKMFPKEFHEKFYRMVPSGLLTWTKAITLAQDRYDSAIILIWTNSSEVQLAVVTEPVEGRVVVVTPSSYLEHPGRACLICRHSPNGTLRKIGIGLGKRVKASSRGTFLLTA
jgi:hypothetical protein